MPTSPLPMWITAPSSSVLHDFTYDAERDVYVCPAGKELHCFRSSLHRATTALSRTCQGLQSLPTQSASVPPVSKAAASAAVSMRTCLERVQGLSGRPKPTKKPCASGRSGSNPYLRKAKTGMACAVFACVGSGASTVRHSCEQQDKISSDC